MQDRRDSEGTVVADLRDFREPFRTEFIQAIHPGAANADIHDASAYTAPTVFEQASIPFLKRELERPYNHTANICRWIRHLTPVERILDVGCGNAGLSVALGPLTWPL